MSSLYPKALQNILLKISPSSLALLLKKKWQHLLLIQMLPQLQLNLKSWLKVKKMKTVKARCDLEGYEGETHGFFNYGRGDNKAYNDTIIKMDAFLESLKWIKK